MRGTAAQILKAIQLFIRDDSFTRGQPSISVTGRRRILSHNGRRLSFLARTVHMISYSCHVTPCTCSAEDIPYV